MDEEIRIGDRVTQRYELDPGVFGWTGVVVGNYPGNSEVVFVDWNERKRTRKVNRRGKEFNEPIHRKSIITARKEGLQKL